MRFHNPFGITHFQKRGYGGVPLRLRTSDLRLPTSAVPRITGHGQAWWPTPRHAHGLRSLRLLATLSAPTEEHPMKHLSNRRDFRRCLSSSALILFALLCAAL